MTCTKRLKAKISRCSELRGWIDGERYQLPDLIRVIALSNLIELNQWMDDERTRIPTGDRCCRKKKIQPQCDIT